MTDLLLRTIRKGILNDSRGEAVSCKLPVDLAGQVLLSTGKESREKKRQIRNYEIRHKTSDECELKLRIERILDGRFEPEQVADLAGICVTASSVPMTIVFTVSRTSADISFNRAASEELDGILSTIPKKQNAL